MAYQPKVRPIRRNPFPEGVTLHDVELRKEEVIKQLEQMGKGIEDSIVSVTYAGQQLSSLNRGAAEEQVTSNIGESRHEVTETTGRCTENFYEAHDGIYDKMGMLTSEARISDRAWKELGERGIERGWKLLNETVFALYTRQVNAINAAAKMVADATTIGEVEALWQRVQKNSDGTLARMRIIKLMLDEADMGRLVGYGSSRHFYREVENRYNPSWPRQERDRTADLCEEARQLADAAARIRNPEGSPSVDANIGGHWEIAATKALDAAGSSIHSSFRTAARQAAIDYYINAINSFMQAGEHERARADLDEAMDAAISVIHKRKIPRELLDLKAKMEKRE